MTRYELEQRYRECGCNNFKLRDLSDLKNIHDFDVEQLQGYAELPQEQRELFNRTIIKFYNAQGLDIRSRLQPKSVHYVYEVNYTDTNNVVVGEDIYIVKSDGTTVGKRLHRHKFEKDINLALCKECLQKCYLRFELKGKDGWYHFTPKGDWY